MHSVGAWVRPSSTPSTEPQQRVEHESGAHQTLAVEGSTFGRRSGVPVQCRLTHPEKTMNSAEIDTVIARTLAHAVANEERVRRAYWRKRGLSANSFEAACHHVNDASMPHLAVDRVW